jgi:hypothetical protein
MHLRAALAQAGFVLLSSSANEQGQVLRFGRRIGRRMAMLSTWRPAWQVLDMALSAPLWAPHGDARQTQPLHLVTALSLLDAAP